MFLRTAWWSATLRASYDSLCLARTAKLIECVTRLQKRNLFESELRIDQGLAGEIETVDFDPDSGAPLVQFKICFSQHQPSDETPLMNP